MGEAQMSDRFDKILSALLTTAAILIAAILVRREFFARPQAAAASPRPEYSANWSDFLASGYTIGDPSAPVKILEFSDLECPFCKTFHASIRSIREEFPNEVAFVFVHLPLGNHRFALPAARALECARPDSKFAEMLDILYEKQDSFGLKLWASYAHDAGIHDTARFARCARDTIRVQAIEDGIAIAKGLGVHTTPTILVNGWRYTGGLEEKKLLLVVRDLLAGKHPE
jgi:protein-disulfide isomerase